MNKQLDLFKTVNEAEAELLAKETDSNMGTSHKYLIPRVTESPSVTGGYAKAWIIRFHKLNNMSLPPDFREKKKHQYIGMYKGMLKEYDINEKRDILPEKIY